MSKPTDSIDPVPVGLLTGLIEANTFEDASALTLRAILDAGQDALCASQFNGRGSFARATIHLRPGGVYRHLVVMNADENTVSVPSDRGHRLFSSTAWRWLVDVRHPIAIDVNLARIHLNPSESTGAVSDTSLIDPGFSDSRSHSHLMSRDVTHVLAVPLRVAGGSVEGMISVEAQCRASLGLPFVWDRCSQRIGLLADLAAPYLTALPTGPTRVPAVDAFLPVIGRSMASTVELLQVFAQQDEPLLMGGPTGAGKSRLARWCHEHSPFRDHPFEMLDLSAVPEELQMAELFGWKRGAFTGAARDNVGLIARAQGGTLFIDEIGNLSPRSQAGLLHVLEERTYRPLGEGGAEKEANVRFIVGTNENLQEAVRAKRFREDLYYRINVLPVSLPPLNERVDEIPLWANYMINRHHQKTGRPGAMEISPEGQAVLMKEPWPGNLRQLDNILRRAYAIALISLAGDSHLSPILTKDHLDRAMAHEAPLRNRSSFQPLLEAAAAIVTYATGGSGPAFDLDLLDGFKGLVLASALERTGGSLDEVFRLFGRDKLVTSRNHHKAFRREVERAQQLHSAVTKSEPFPFAGLLDRAMTPGESPDEKP